MIQKSKDRKLESFRIFPFIAWGITILFALFVYKITTDLQAVTTNLERQTNNRESAVMDPLNVDTSFPE